MRRITAVLVVVVLAACGGSDSGSGGSSGFTCSIGTGTSGSYRFHYVETNGTCGAISDETSVPGTAAPTGCTTVTGRGWSS